MLVEAPELAQAERQLDPRRPAHLGAIGRHSVERDHAARDLQGMVSVRNEVVARVRESGSRNVQVGSNLEFLKVGRKLEVEDLEAGGRRQAQIDGVSV